MEIKTWQRDHPWIQKCIGVYQKVSIIEWNLILTQGSQAKKNKGESHKNFVYIPFKLQMKLSFTEDKETGWGSSGNTTNLFEKWSRCHLKQFLYYSANADNCTLFL